MVCMHQSDFIFLEHKRGFKWLWTSAVWNRKKTSPLAIQTTCSYSARAPYNREETSLPSILSYPSFQLMEEELQQESKHCHANKSGFEAKLNAKVPGLHWPELWIHPSFECASTHTHTPALWDRGPPCVPPGQHRQTGRQATLSTARHSGWMCYE